METCRLSLYVVYYLPLQSVTLYDTKLPITKKAYIIQYLFEHSTFFLCIYYGLVDDQLYSTLEKWISTYL